MKKLLLLGNNYHVDALIRCAQKRGVYVIVTDNLPAEKSPVKLLADEAWDIDVTDIDSLEEKALGANVTAITCGASELCMASARSLCKRLNLPFYVSDKAWEITNDKILFKETCAKLNLPVAESFKLNKDFNAEDLSKVRYPVIVKPADGCSSIGLHKCHDEDELVKGYLDAYDKSASKRVIVEEYLSGEEVTLVFAFKNGKADLLEYCTSIGSKDDEIPFVFAWNPPRNLDELKMTIIPKLEKLFKEMECEQGIGTVQLISDGSAYKLTEMNYRLPGSQVTYQEYQVSVILDYLLSENLSDTIVLDKGVDIASYIIWLKPGTISSIQGLDFLKENLALINFNPMKKVGDVIADGSGMRQMFGLFVINLSKQAHAEAIDLINKNLIILDENGRDMVHRYYFDENAGVLNYEG